MPTYELCMILKNMPKAELVSTMKRAAQSVFNQGGIIRKINNMGSRDLPYKMKNHGKIFKEGSYFMYEFDAPPSKLDIIREECGRDVDIIRSMIYKQNTNEPFECTIGEEMKPPPYRSEVIQMVEEAKKREAKKKFKYNTGLDYYPFQK